MTSDPTVLHVLLVEDDQENLDLLIQTLPAEIDDHRIEWEPCDSFERAEQLVALRRFDIVVTDIYLDKPDHPKGVDPADEKAKNIVAAIRNRRFCPIVAFSDASVPPTFTKGPFVRFADKSGGNEEILNQLRELLATGIPSIARKLHDELDQSNGSYLWEFLESRWQELKLTGVSDPAILERLVRRRAAMQLGRLSPGVASPTELDSVNGVEYYIYPRVSDELRLGEIIRSKKDEAIHVILTPHCYLKVQDGDMKPRADHVLTVKAFPAKDTITVATKPKSPWKGDESDKLDKLRRRTKLEAELGKPSGRYCFLPRFLDIPDIYCDLLQTESLPLGTITDDYDRLAVLDTPFAEALQSCFARFHSRVGVPELAIDGVRHLVD
ncbi:MAG: response regulator [Pirellulales bacterium]|nr:response regulator [Pirellulales bacterium]